MSALVEGLLNPLTVPAHALAVLALGLLIGRQPPGWRQVTATAAFAAGLIAGVAAIVLATRQDAAGDALLAATAAAAALVALAKQLPNWTCAALALAIGLALALDSPPQAISIAVATVTLAGTVLGACLALAIIAAVAGRLRRPWQRIGMRIVGSWVAASAILVLALHFARGPAP
jgi:hydrogenase/urease accessory protein HupE